jgi:hypothetical protein
MKELKLSDIRVEPSHTISKGLWVGYASDFAEEKYGNIDFEVFLPSKGINLQRDFVWDLFQKQQLIISLLKGIKIPHLSIIQYSPNEQERVYKIIDGKQRLSTLISFYRNEFSIEWEGENYYYQELDRKAQKEIELFGVQADVMYEWWDDMISDEDKIKWFEMINFLGTPQDQQHLNKLKQ